MTANALPTRSTIAATINKVFIILCLRQQIDLCLSYLDECTLNARHTRASLKLLLVGGTTWRTPQPTSRGGNFCSFHLIIKYQLVLVMYGLEDALNTNVVALA